MESRGIEEYVREQFDNNVLPSLQGEHHHKLHLLSCFFRFHKDPKYIQDV